MNKTEIIEALARVEKAEIESAQLMAPEIKTSILNIIDRAIRLYRTGFISDREALTLLATATACAGGGFE